MVLRGFTVLQAEGVAEGKTTPVWARVPPVAEMAQTTALLRQPLLELPTQGAVVEVRTLLP